MHHFPYLNLISKLTTLNKPVTWIGFVKIDSLQRTKCCHLEASFFRHVSFYLKVFLKKYIYKQLLFKKLSLEVWL